MAPPDSTVATNRKLLAITLQDFNFIYEHAVKATDFNSGDVVTAMQTFRAMYPNAENLFQEYKALFKETLASASLGEEPFPKESDTKQRERLHLLYYKIVECYQQIEALVKPAATSPNAHAGDLDQNRSVLNSSLARNRLPKITLPTFTGIIEEWPKFKQLFLSMIHNNTEIPTLEKYHYLTSVLNDEPSAIIAPFPISEGNYTLAWSALTRRYDNKRLLALRYLENIFDFPPLKGEPNLQSLQSFISGVGEAVASFKSLGVEDETDFIWLAFALKRLDPETRRAFESHYVDKEWPTFSELMEFIYNKCKVMQLSERGPPVTRSLTVSRIQKSKPLERKGRTRVFNNVEVSSEPSQPRRSCPCKERHSLYYCDWFRAQPTNARLRLVRDRSLCYNCLNHKHTTKLCKSRYRCRVCNLHHNTLLHEALSTREKVRERRSSVQPSASAETPTNLQPPNPVITSVTSTSSVILGTARAFVRDSRGFRQTVRLLLDCGAQCSLITAECARRLGFTWRPCTKRPQGPCGTIIPKVKGQLTFRLFSKTRQDASLEVNPLVVNTITDPLPSSIMAKLNVAKLADPQFWKPDNIDILLGADHFMRVLTGPPRSLALGYEAVPTLFGLVVMGSAPPSKGSTDHPRCHLVTEGESIDQILTKFWETEEVATTSSVTQLDPCEQHYTNTHTRDNTGRYVLALPFSRSPDGLQNSKRIAMSQYLNLERRLSRDPILKEKYDTFLRHYREMGHMSETSEPSKCVIPHHAVFKTQDSSGDIRVVFNASVQTDNGSLNDRLHAGPKLQTDLTIIIANFRRHRVALSADLIKMFRQIWIRPEDRPYLHILWRPDETSEVKTFSLNTVTYGLACAPYQAIRTIRQLVEDEGDSYPLASRVLLEDSYVDDIVTGGSTDDEIQGIREELTALLAKGGFSLHKWASNHPLSPFSSLSNNEQPLGLTPKEVTGSKILGMYWDPSKDYFYYRLTRSDQPFTKRGVLSVIARLFDPMGFLSPVIFKAKMLLQDLWIAGLDWDDPLPRPLQVEWKDLLTDFPLLHDIVIPRYILTTDRVSPHLVGFCDASMRGYSAVFYLRAPSSAGEVKVNIVKAKSKLAPLKTISVPRLELSAAHLLVKLYLSLSKFIENIGSCAVSFFTDSMIVLGWLNLSPHTLETFVANRVSFIQTHTLSSQWYHVPTHLNPADLNSRGLAPSMIVGNSLWWEGPPFLSDVQLRYPQSPRHSEPLPEVKQPRTFALALPERSLIDWMECFSNYSRLLRSMAYVLRFINNSRHVSQRVIGEFTASEIESARTLCIKIVQAHAFRDEFPWHDKGKWSYRLKTLVPSLDDKGLIRVGGRLKNADLPPETMHPVIMPGNSRFMALLIKHLHCAHMHLSYNGLHALIRREYWVFGLRRAIKTQLNACLICTKIRHKVKFPLMGQLPSARVRPARPFSECGVDYAGPFNIKQSMNRNAPVTKAYLCIFVCFATRAVHLELVSSLSTDAFLATLERFIARRGKPKTIHSDNGTNFQGAAHYFDDLKRQLTSDKHVSETQRYLSMKGINWNFIPPYSPHFGGLWEAGVKSVKGHLVKFTRQNNFTYEELATIFCRIEAILNSRPLALLSGNNEFGDPLTPGHFLIGSPLLSPPEQDLREVPLNRLSRWQLISHFIQSFWSRWQVEYLRDLQRRCKWHTTCRQIQVDDVVLLSDPNTSPLQWKMGRILACHPGRDNITRVVTLRTAHGEYKLPVHKLVKLPLDSQEDS